MNTAIDFFPFSDYANTKVNHSDILWIMEKYADAKTKELQKEIDEKNKEICDLLDWGNGKDDELDRLEQKITELENDYMQVQTNEQLARFEKEDKLNMGRVNP